MPMTDHEDDDQMVTLRVQVSMLAEHVGRAIRVISEYQARGWDTEAAEARLQVLENLMWKLHARHMRLKAGIERAPAAPLLH